VPQGCLVGARWLWQGGLGSSTGGARPKLIHIMGGRVKPRPFTFVVKKMAVREKPLESERAWRPRKDRGPLVGLFFAPVFLALAALLIFGYQRTLMSLTLDADGQVRTLRTHQTTVEAVLREAGLTLFSEDIVEPALDERVFVGDTISVRRARPVAVQVDGHTIDARTQLTETHAILAELDVTVGPHDEVHQLQDEVNSGEVGQGGGGDAEELPPLQIQIERAVPIVVLEDGSPPLHIDTTAPTVGEALREAGIILYLADDVRPSFSSPIESGARISIKRSVPVTVHVDGSTLRTRTHRTTVGEVLADAGISLQGLDYAEPDLGVSLGEGQEIRVVRVREELLVHQEPTPFETQWAPNPELEIDHQALGQQGEPGVYERRIRVRYEDGAEIDRWVEAEWVAKSPQPKILNYGTKIVLRTIDTPEGPREYWRKFRMLATSYTAASAGKSPDHPYYGITRLGWRMRDGIVAVDPKIVRLGSQVFVSGYGVGDAADTGGAIRNFRIDLGYSEEHYVSWYRCVDVYLLAPVPDNVEYVLGSLVHPWCR
jgi:uncharacterized protein YabE (DUF348 family)